MKVLLTGAAGQLGHALLQQVPEGVELIVSSRTRTDGTGDGSRADAAIGWMALVLADAAACRAAGHRHRPDWVLNSGAYTAVDKAESESELAQDVNAGAPRLFAEALAETGGRLLQVSTDFVFNGAQGYPYRPDQARDPLGVYGASKAAGEEAVEQELGGEGRGLILQTSWLMGPVGRNFALTMLRLHRERASSATPFVVVADQVGCPTSSHTLAAACWRAIERGSSNCSQLNPILHWSGAGATSWYDMAVAVGEFCQELGVLERLAQVTPITMVESPTPTQRPSYALLDCSETRQVLGLPALHWRQALGQLLMASC